MRFAEETGNDVGDQPNSVDAILSEQMTCQIMANYCQTATAASSVLRSQGAEHPINT